MKPKHDYVVKYSTTNPAQRESRRMSYAAVGFIVLLCLLSSFTF